jgi:enoyl-CoA hydratase/carnithine racemase
MEEGRISLVRTLAGSESDLLVLCMNRGENLFNGEMVRLMAKALSVVQREAHPKALVIRANEGNKFFSNGHDLDDVENEQEMNELVQRMWREVLAPLLIMDCRTVAAINGHAFGAGLFLALACDFRVMRTKRGYLNFPELNLGMPLNMGYIELARCKLSGHGYTLRNAILSAIRYGSKQALAAGIIDYECPVDQLQSTSNSLALAGTAESLKLLRFDPTKFVQMKIELYKDAYRALTIGKATDDPKSRL